MDFGAFEAAFPEATLYYDEPLKKYAYTKVGGPADLLVFPKTVDELAAMIKEARTLSIPYLALGNSSNVLISDRGIAGIVFMLTELKAIAVDGEAIEAQAGAPLIAVSQAAGEAQLTGLEFACGIPGSVGGAMYMNAGAYGGEVKDIVESVTVLTVDGELATRTHDEMDFGYRHSLVQDNHDTVVAVRFALAKGDPAAIQATMADLTERRERKQPLELPSCGSVFKRPVGHYTGPLIQQSGLQGYTVGGAQVSMKHAGFIVNIGGATAQDYLDVIHHVQATVYRDHGVALEPEVRIIGRAMPADNA